jgi:hypothetical protein
VGRLWGPLFSVSSADSDLPGAGMVRMAILANRKKWLVERPALCLARAAEETSLAPVVAETGNSGGLVPRLAAHLPTPQIRP